MFHIPAHKNPVNPAGQFPAVDVALNEAIFDAIRSVLLGNNGYADIGQNRAVADGVAAAGFIVIATKNLHVAKVFRAFTKASQAALAVAPYGVSTYQPPKQSLDGPDYEGMILARDERLLEGL